MSDFGEMVIGLDRNAADKYAATLRFRPAGSEADRQELRMEADINLAELAEASLDTSTYGRHLDSIFSDEAFRKEFDSARAVCEASSVPLRVRLHIGPGAPELHKIRWECLGDSRDPDKPLLIQEQIHFSRYLTSMDWRPVMRKPRSELSALMAIASPSDIGRFKGLAPIDAPGLVERAKKSLKDVTTTFLAEPGEATLENISQALTQGYDILYLVAHGVLARGEPYLFLTDKEGITDRVKGADLLERLKELDSPPSIAVLASCQSAGEGDCPLPNDQAKEWSAQSALGPRLSSAGIPSVLAMQGNISMETEATFIPRFLEELSQDGRIDRAMSLARARVKDRPDWWMPVLFTRLRGGSIWYNQGFGDSEEAQDKWPALVSHIQASRAAAGGGEDSGRGRRRRRRRSEGGCTPLLGPGMLEPYVGRIQDISSWWAEQQGFPLATHETEQLARIAQFIDVKVELKWLHKELERHLCSQLKKRHESRIPPDVLKDMDADAFMGDALIEVSEALEADGKHNNHKMLAGLNLPIYLTTTPDNLLSDTLKAQGKDPIVDICRWNDDLVHDKDPVFEPMGEERPTPDRPLVFHLFGNLDDHKSLVLSEDDHFDFLTGFIRYKDHIPSVVRAAMNTTALMFVGFSMDDWSFRVLFRAIMSQEGLAMADNLAHIAAQVNPEEGRLIDPEGTRKFLNQVMGKANISLYWGDVAPFLKELQQKIEEAGGAQ